MLLKHPVLVFKTQLDGSDDDKLISCPCKQKSDDDDDGNLAKERQQIKMLLLTGVIDTYLYVRLLGIDYSLVHRLPGPDLCLLPCLPG